MNAQTISTGMFRRGPLPVTHGAIRRANWTEILPSTIQWDVSTVAARSLMDHVQIRLRDEPQTAYASMYDLLSGLVRIKSEATPEAWQNVIAQCAAHPVRELIHQDPFTGRSFGKPRGYAGDAVLIDYIYSRNCRLYEHDAVSPLGERIFAFNRDTPACAAVRARRDLMTSMIDDVCIRIRRPHILSVACGHLREASLSSAVDEGRVGRFVALDQDELSLQVVASEVSDRGVIPVCSSVKALFRGELSHQKFDFIYSTGLYDYLDERVAIKLTHRMFDMLNPGGRLIVANFLPGIWGAGYMETFMDWKLIYRTADEMAGVASQVPEREIEILKTYVEPNNNIVFLELVKR